MPKFQLFFLQIMVTISLDNPHELNEFHQPYTKRLDAENQDDRINLESQRAMKKCMLMYAVCLIYIHYGL